jgi:hypothetical protein
VSQNGEKEYDLSCNLVVPKGICYQDPTSLLHGVKCCGTYKGGLNVAPPAAVGQCWWKDLFKSHVMAA